MNWVSYAYKLLANREKYMDLYEQLKPIIREAQQRLPQVDKLLKELDPELAEQPSQQSSLQKPDSEFSVEWMQESLNKLSNADLVVDGDYGEKTREAVRQYQGENDLDPDGWAGIQTCVKIYQQLQEA
jgi:peptidoglycan hydrolase-like protein with peptidoglycan-binding domain